MTVAKWLVSVVKPVVERSPRVASIYRSVRDQLDLGAEPVATPWGFKLAGNAAMARGTFEPVETELIKTILKRVDVLINVGANVGYYCCHALSMGKAVIAFEPIDRNLRYLYKNIKANGWSGAEVYPIALSDHTGILEIYGGNTGASVVRGWAGTPESYVTLVPSSTLDVVLGTRLQGKKALILVDVEGAEKAVIEGAKKMLANDPKPIWVVEIMSTDHQPVNVGLNPHLKRTFQLFYENGYRSFTFDGKMTPIRMEDVEMVLASNVRLPAHNFIFGERDSAL